MLKAHSGSDFIEARTLHSKTFKTFQPTHKIVFLTNNPPRTEDVGPSMQRRVRMSGSSRTTGTRSGTTRTWRTG
jgi:phage/plasmid-associated DNA primase